MNKSEKYFYIALIALTIFIIGVQVGIYHGRELAKVELSRMFFNGY